MAQELSHHTEDMITKIDRLYVCSTCGRREKTKANLSKAACLGFTPNQLYSKQIRKCIAWTRTLGGAGSRGPMHGTMTWLLEHQTEVMPVTVHRPAPPPSAVSDVSERLGSESSPQKGAELIVGREAEPIINAPDAPRIPGTTVMSPVAGAAAALLHDQAALLEYGQRDGSEKLMVSPEAGPIMDARASDARRMPGAAVMSPDAGSGASSPESCAVSPAMVATSVLAAPQLEPTRVHLRGGDTILSDALTVDMELEFVYPASERNPTGECGELVKRTGIIWKRLPNDKLLIAQVEPEIGTRTIFIAKMTNVEIKAQSPP